MKQSVLQKLKSKIRQTVKLVPVIDNSPIKVSIVDNPIWLKNELTRDVSASYLMDKEIGVFLVRQSESIRDCYVLSVKVAKFINSNEISHYIILNSSKHGEEHARFSIRGFNKEFTDLKSLVTHCSFIRDMLPVLLDLNFYRNEIGSYKRKSVDDFYYYSGSTCSIKSSMPSASSIGSLSSECSID